MKLPQVTPAGQLSTATMDALTSLSRDELLNVALLSVFNSVAYAGGAVETAAALRDNAPDGINYDYTGPAVDSDTVQTSIEMINTLAPGMIDILRDDPKWNDYEAQGSRSAALAAVEAGVNSLFATIDTTGLADAVCHLLVGTGRATDERDEPLNPTSESGHFMMDTIDRYRVLAERHAGTKHGELYANTVQAYEHATWEHDDDGTIAVVSSSVAGYVKVPVNLLLELATALTATEVNKASLVACSDALTTIAAQHGISVGDYLRLYVNHEDVRADTTFDIDRVTPDGYVTV